MHPLAVVILRGLTACVQADFWSNPHLCWIKHVKTGVNKGKTLVFPGQIPICLMIKHSLTCLNHMKSSSILIENYHSLLAAIPVLGAALRPKTRFLTRLDQGFSGQVQLQQGWPRVFTVASEALKHPTEDGYEILHQLVTSWLPVGNYETLEMMG